MTEQAKFTYSSIGQAFENQIKTNEGTFEKHTHTHTHTHTQKQLKVELKNKS